MNLLFCPFFVKNDISICILVTPDFLWRGQSQFATYTPVLLFLHPKKPSAIFRHPCHPLSCSRPTEFLLTRVTPDPNRPHSLNKTRDFLFFPKANGTNTKEEITFLVDSLTHNHETEDLFTICIHSSLSFWGPHSSEIDWIIEVLDLFELAFVPDIVLGSGSCGRTCPPFYHSYQVRLCIWLS